MGLPKTLEWIKETQTPLFLYPAKLGATGLRTHTSHWEEGRGRGHQYKLVWREKALIFLPGWQLATVDGPSGGSSGEQLWLNMYQCYLWVQSFKPVHVIWKSGCSEGRKMQWDILLWDFPWWRLTRALLFLCEDTFIERRCHLITVHYFHIFEEGTSCKYWPLI